MKCSSALCKVCSFSGFTNTYSAPAWKNACRVSSKPSAVQAYTTTGRCSTFLMVRVVSTPSK
ncbi:Uncharacterised protein [Vibrio cholerae]|nr:Uncharacterised protein [Vibrio cholerae]